MVRLLIINSFYKISSIIQNVAFRFTHSCNNVKCSICCMWY